MSLYVLDTDILTLLQEGHPGVVQRVGSHPASEIAISVITVEEQLTGWYTRVRRAKKRDELARAYDRLARNARFLGRLTILPFPESAILRYDRLSALKL